MGTSNASDSVCKGSSNKPHTYAPIDANKQSTSAAATSANCCLVPVTRDLDVKLQISSNPCDQLVLFANNANSNMSGDQKTLIKGHSSQYVKLNVGGRLYYTTIGTLTKHNDTMLSAMFSGRMEVLTDAEGELENIF